MNSRVHQGGKERRPIQKARGKVTYTSIAAVRNDLYPGSPLPPPRQDLPELARQLGHDVARELLMNARGHAGGKKTG